MESVVFTGVMAVCFLIITALEVSKFLKVLNDNETANRIKAESELKKAVVKKPRKPRVAKAKVE